MPNYTIRKSSYFDETFAACVAGQEVREEIERGIRFALRHLPEHGKFTGQSAPLPIYAWKIVETARNPALTVFYTFDTNKQVVILISVRISEVP